MVTFLFYLFSVCEPAKASLLPNAQAFKTSKLGALSPHDLTGFISKVLPLDSVSIPGSITHDHLVPENQALSVCLRVSKWAI